MTCEKMQGYEMMEPMMDAGGMGKMAESTPLTLATQQKPSSIPKEPSIEEQIEQIKSILDWLSEIKDEVDEDTWLSLTATLEKILKELEKD